MTLRGAVLWGWEVVGVSGLASLRRWALFVGVLGLLWVSISVA